MKAARMKKPNMLTRLCVLVFAGYAAVTLVTLQMEINAKQSDLAAVNNQIEVQRLQTKELERQISLGDNEAYLARLARDKLDMCFSDERVYQDVSGS